jgi:hypothetical protein
MDHQLGNKRALVTGSSRGIGAAIVCSLARRDPRTLHPYPIRKSTLDVGWCAGIVYERRISDEGIRNNDEIDRGGPV